MPKLYKSVDNSNGYLTGYIINDDGKQKRFLFLGRGNNDAVIYAIKQVAENKLFTDRPIMGIYAIDPILIAEW
jgi:hypothetical protein